MHLYFILDLDDQFVCYYRALKTKILINMLFLKLEFQVIRC